MKSTSVTDARVRKTQSRLRDALVALIHEKNYDSIVVADILKRADVGRSAFYTHFANKHELLASGIEHILHASPARRSRSELGAWSEVLSFSLPFFEYIGQCRHATNLRTTRRGRAVVHGHLRKLLVNRVALNLKSTTLALQCDSGMPADLLTEHIVNTFVLVLNWWVDTQSPLSPREIDDLFLTLIRPAVSPATRPNS